MRSTASSEEASETSSSEDIAPTPTVAGTAVRQLGSHVPDPRDGGEIREGRTRVQTKVLQQRNTDGLITMLASNEGGQLVQALVAEQVEKSNGLP
ncbi:unnamed protein product, partial [Sphacelaria rigidula]